MPMAALAASPFQPEGESHHGIAVDQRLELGQHWVQHGLPALGRYSLTVAGQPFLERILAARQPPSPTPRVSSGRVVSRRISRKEIRHRHHVLPALASSNV